MSKTTYPTRRRVPTFMMEHAVAQRNRSVPLKPRKSREPLSLTQPNAAGIDVGSASHYVAVPPDRDDLPVREFPSFTRTCTAWRTGCRPAASTPSRWSPPAFSP